jgi:septal ring factor EnvC (AmiA/AmiB activator)
MVARTPHRGRNEMTVGIQDPPQRMDRDENGPWNQIGELFVRAQSRTDARLGRLEGDVCEIKTDVEVLKTDVAVLKTDVAVLKTDVADLKTGLAETNQRLSRFEFATERRFDRVDAQLERLITLVQRDEMS